MEKTGLQMLPSASGVWGTSRNGSNSVSCHTHTRLHARPPKRELTHDSNMKTFWIRRCFFFSFVIQNTIFFFIWF